MLQVGPLASHALRIVVADDSDADRKVVRQLLSSERNFVIDEAADSDRLASLVGDGEVDCVLIDTLLGAESGFAIHERLLSMCKNPPAMIMLTGNGNENVATKALRCGFDDYLRKPGLEASELTAAILRASVRRHAERMNEDEMLRLSAQALRDRTTGLPNRQYLDERLAALIASGERQSRARPPSHDQRFAVMLIGINAFTQVNDSFGHAVGDAAIKAFADRLRDAAHISDCFGRFEQDKFLYIIEGQVSSEAVELTARHLVDTLSLPIQLDAVGLNLSASIGVAFYPADGSAAGTLLLAAHRAMQAARSSGSGHLLAADAPLIAGAGQLAEVPIGDADPGASVDHSAGEETARDGPAAIRREDNQRSERRNRVLKRGLVLTNNGFSTVDCVLHDMSAHGACLVMEAAYAVPSRFRLLVTENGAEFAAEKRWQRGNAVGVRFIA